jgi:hypothetical protein
MRREARQNSLSLLGAPGRSPTACRRFSAARRTTSMPSGSRDDASCRGASALELEVVRKVQRGHHCDALDRACLAAVADFTHPELEERRRHP